MVRSSLFLLAALLSLAARRETAAATYSFLDYPGASYTETNGISAGSAGGSSTQIIAGSFGPGLGPQDTGTIGAFGLQIRQGPSGSTYIFHPLQQAANTIKATGVNDRGSAVGFFPARGYPTHGFLSQSGTFTQLDVPFSGAKATFAQGINDAGTIVGAWVDGSALVHGFTLANGSFAQVPDYPGAYLTSPSGINASGDMVGYEQDSAGFHGFLLSNGAYTQLNPPGSAYTIAVGINDAGTIVGYFCKSADACTNDTAGIEGFLFSGGRFTTLDFPGSPDTFLNGVSNAGLVVGDYRDAATGFLHGFTTKP